MQLGKQKLYLKIVRSADVAWKVFLKSTSKPKGGSKIEGRMKVQISQDDYYTWLEENQSMFKLAIPDF